MKKVLITGANGFLGCNLTRELFRRGYEIRVLVRPHADMQTLSDIPCEVFYGHIDKPEDVQQAVAGCNIVVHAAAITDQWNISFEQYERINYTATRYIAEAVLQYGVERFIFVSTAATMDPGSKAKPGTELNGFTLFKANSNYITTKYLAQQYVLEQAEQKQLPVVVVNPTFMIGAYDAKPSSGELLLHGVNKGVVWCPPGGKSFVNILDVCRGIANAIEQGKTGDCYLLAGQNMSYRQFFKLVNRVTGARSVLITIPAFVLRFGGMLGSIKQRLLRHSSKLNNSTAYLLCIHNYYTGKKSERALDLKYTPVEEAIKDALDWFKEHNYY